MLNNIMLQEAANDLTGSQGLTGKKIMEGPRQVKLEGTDSRNLRNHSTVLVNKGEVYSPITHRVMSYTGQSQSRTGHYKPSGSMREGSATARAISIKSYNDQTLNFTKTSIQARAEGQVKPKAYNAWDLLALNDMI